MTDSPDPSLSKMRRLATGLLVVMAILFVLARSMEGTGAFWPWLKAFAEAAMVGAMADWFAVTALFRHPLGLPIPHTAIVKKEKARIGAAVASFVRKSFLTPDEVTRQWMEWKPMRRIAKHLSCPENATRRLKWMVSRLPDLLKKSDRENLARLGASGIRHGVGTVPMARILTILLKGFLKSPGRRDLISPIIGRIGKSVSDNRDWVMEEAGKATKPKKIKVVDFLSKAAASAVSGKAVEKFASQMAAASADPEHPIYDKIEEALRETAIELESGGVERWEAIKARVIVDPETVKTVQEVVDQGLRLFLESVEAFDENGTIERWSEVIAGAATRLVSDESRMEDLEDRAAKMAARFFGRYGDSAEKLVNRTVDSWEADELIARIENQVGADLQFIRVNGTLIGGFVGLLLHGVGLLVWGS
mgnify:CR=1 FL=1